VSDNVEKRFETDITYIYIYIYKLWCICHPQRAYTNIVEMHSSKIVLQFFNFNLFFIRLTHRGYDWSDMELVNTGNKVTNIIHDVRYNTLIFRIHLSR
jgi:hypothetical protein